MNITEIMENYLYAGEDTFVFSTKAWDELTSEQLIEIFDEYGNGSYRIAVKNLLKDDNGGFGNKIDIESAADKVMWHPNFPVENLIGIFESSMSDYEWDENLELEDRVLTNHFDRLTFKQLISIIKGKNLRNLSDLDKELLGGCAEFFGVGIEITEIHSISGNSKVIEILGYKEN